MTFFWKMMRTIILIGLFLGGELICLSACAKDGEPRADSEKSISYTRDIRPILSDACYACHGPDGASREAELRLDVHGAALRELPSGCRAVVPNSPEESELIRRVLAEDEQERMPPPDSGKSLKPEQIELLRRWIAEGASWKRHWAFVPPVLPEVPQVLNDSWPRNPIDSFVLSRLEAKGWSPQPAAGRPTLIRRVTFDLIGLPPTPEEVEAFESDPAALGDALARVVDRLLASPHYGEHQAAEWLQLARFADSNGYQNDFRREMWPWRDWVIKAFNANMPYDQFVLEQNAGDLLPNPTQDQLVATGFHRNNRTVTEGGSIDEEWRVENNVDRVETTAMAFLGLTMGCARCHDHKYDPISQRDFYRFYAFFNSIDEKGVYEETRDNVPPLVQCPTPEQTQRLKDLDIEAAQAKKNFEQRISECDPQVEQWLASLRAAVERKSAPVADLNMPLAGTLMAVEHGRTEDAELASKQPPTWQAGLPGEVLHLTGAPNSYVDLGQRLTPDRHSPFSFAVWVQPEVGNATIVSCMNDANRSRGWDALLLPDMRLKVHLIHAWDENAIAVITKNAVHGECWTHLAVSYDGSSKAAGIRVYFNGEPVETIVEKDALTESIATEQSTRLGSRSTSFHYRGSLARFSWFDRILSAPEINSLLAGELAEPQGLSLADWSPARRDMIRTSIGLHQLDPVVAAKGEWNRLRQEKAKLESEIPTSMVLKDRDPPRPTYLLTRGVYNAPDKSEELTPAVPGFLPPLPADIPSNRQALARWLVDENNPLLARVYVNRVWQRLFGRGLVATVDDFGSQGAPPTHPELLDWLAREFIASGWDIKQLYRTIVSSATYQQSSAAPGELYARDPENRFLARGARFRLSAEAIRDNALTISGLLSTRIGGPSAKPYQPEGLWDELAGGANEGPYVLSSGEDLYRRSLYTNRKRTVPHPTLATFDAPSFEICRAKRSVTNTPLQALALLNDVTYVECARGLAQRMMAEGGSNLADRIRYAFRLATAHAPSERELSVLKDAFAWHRKRFADDPDSAPRLLSHGNLPTSTDQNPVDMAAYCLTASLILNLDETITHE